MPPLLREWVPEGHLVWTVLDAVGEMDLGAFYVSYHADGRGRPACDPSMMVASLPYAYPRGNRSSRGIERACVEDVACRVICSNLVLDHSTIAEFRVRYEDALAELFTSVLLLCRKAGWSGSAWLLSMGQGSGRTPRARPIAAMSRSRARSWPRRRRRTGARTSFMARRAAMSCRSGWPRARGGGPRCARPGRSSNASVRGSTARRGRREPGRPRLWRSGSTRRGLLPAPMVGGREAPGARGAARAGGAADPAVAVRAALGVGTPAGGGACGRAPGEPGSRSSISMVRSTCTTRRSRSSSRATHVGCSSGGVACGPPRPPTVCGRFLAAIAAPRSGFPSARRRSSRSCCRLGPAASRAGRASSGSGTARARVCG
jgi:transposase